ncbi:MAG TPA: FecR domain-containing protein [Gemmatimonadaceae bacterium]|jgi:transmembrane sensor
MNMANSGPNPEISPDDWERIARYITGEATAAEAAATHRWMQADPQRIALIRLLESVLENVPRDDFDDVDVEAALTGVKARFDDPKVIPLGSRLATMQESRSLSALLRIAAAAIVLLAATTIWQYVRRSQADGVGQSYATSVGERREVSLGDGTRVLLGPTSRLAVLPEGGARGVALDGIAYFNVVHDSAHPFTVKAGAITIRDVGTAFSVENNDSAGTRVAVDSGSVAIGASDQPAGEGAVLHARDRAVADPSGTVAVERSAVSDDDHAWVQGRLVFRDATLGLVGAELYRWYGVRLKVADASLANLHLTASFSGEPVDRVLNVIALSLGARIEHQGNVAFLYKASASGPRP